jgi:hypothetical protein
MRKIKFFPYLIFCLLTFSCANSFEEGVEFSILKQLSFYPESNLQDLYKNFFQDRFGPEHLISDTAMAGEYLREELESYTLFTIENPLFEEIGWEGNFYRVSTDVLKMDIIPYSVYMDAFIESANTTPKVSVKEWKAEWNKILSIIENMEIKFPNYEKDKANLQALIDSGKYVIHHSKKFETIYRPHYRIIEKELFLKKIKPLLQMND